MDLSSETIHDIIHPTAAFADALDESTLADASIRSGPSLNRVNIPWDDSQLNPKNRIDSLEEHGSPLWRVDGCSGLGTQFYLVPLFLDPRPPYRIDAFIPRQQDHPTLLRKLLELDTAFHTKDRFRVQRLGISQLIVRKLQQWTRNLADPAAWYTGLRYGSRIVFRNLSLHLREIEIQIADTWYLEGQLLATNTLQALWGANVQLPPTIDIAAVSVVEQLHDSVCVVRIEKELWILKALTSYTKYLYHELKQLLSIPQHPNLISRPAHLVTKLCAFGHSIKIIGFTTEYHPNSSLRDIVPLLRLNARLTLRHKVTWSLQLASALQCLRATTDIYYPDLRLDNVVLSDQWDAIMIDFEQRGVWAEFASPEVNALEYVRLLALDEDIPEETNEKYISILRDLLPEYESLTNRETYTNPPRGYNIPWLCLSPAEQEAAEVYMLGRVMWCLFEGVSAPQRSAVWQSYRWESDIEFPQYRSTPEPMRRLIDQCTRGHSRPLSDVITRDGNCVVLRHDGPGTEADIRRVASQWWRKEIESAEAFLKMRNEKMANGTWTGNHFQRPSISEVVEALEQFRNETM